MPSRDILMPVANAVIKPSKPITVKGVVHTRGMPEPVSIDSVKVQFQGRSIDATLKSNPPQLSTVNFSAQATTSAALGPRVVSVTATDEFGHKAMKTVTVLVGQGPLDATLVGPLTIKTGYSLAPGPDL